MAWVEICVMAGKSSALRPCLIREVQQSSFQIVITQEKDVSATMNIDIYTAFKFPLLLRRLKSDPRSINTLKIMFASTRCSSDLVHSAGKFITRQEERTLTLSGWTPSSQAPATYFTLRKMSSHKTVSKEVSNRCTLVSFPLRHAERRVHGILEGVSRLRMLKYRRVKSNSASPLWLESCLRERMGLLLDRFTAGVVLLDLSVVVRPTSYTSHSPHPPSFPQITPLSSQPELPNQKPALVASMLEHRDRRDQQRVPAGGPNRLTLLVYKNGQVFLGRCPRYITSRNDTKRLPIIFHWSGLLAHPLLGESIIWPSPWENSEGDCAFGCGREVGALDVSLYGNWTLRKRTRNESYTFVEYAYVKPQRGPGYRRRILGGMSMPIFQSSFLRPYRIDSTILPPIKIEISIQAVDVFCFSECWV